MCKYSDEEIIIKTPLLDYNLKRVIFNNTVYEIDAGCVKSITFTFNAGEIPRLNIERIPDINKTKTLIKEKEYIKQFTKKDVVNERPLDAFIETGEINSKPELSNTISSNDIISAKEKLEHNRASLKSWNCYITPGRRQGKSWFQDIFMQYWEQNKNEWELIGVDMSKEEDQNVIIDDSLIRDEDGGYIVPDDIGNEIIETIRKQSIDEVSDELDKSFTKIESEDEYFDDIKPMIVKRDNK